MLDGINTGNNRGPDAVGSVRMSGNLATVHMGFVNQRLHFFKRVLLATDAVTLRQYTAGCTELDDVRAVLDGFPDLGADRPRTVRHAFGALVELAG